MSAEQYAWNELQRTRDQVEALEKKLSAVRDIIERDRPEGVNPWELLREIDLATSAESSSKEQA